MNLLSLAERILRDPMSRVTDDAPTLAERAPGLLALTAGGAAVFGLVIGTYRGGLQLAYAPLKAPLLLLVPLAITLPALRVLLGHPAEPVPTVRLASAGLVGMALAGIGAAALSPALWFLYSLAPDYHLSVLAMAGLLGLSALPGLLTVVRAVPHHRPRVLPTAFALGLLAMTTAQTGWLLRPFVVRPQAEIALLRPVEADVARSLASSGASAGGVYETFEAKRSPFVRAVQSQVEDADADAEGGPR